MSEPSVFLPCADCAGLFKETADSHCAELAKARAETAVVVEALEEAVEQLLTLANETYWTLHAVTTESGIPGRDLDAALLAKSLIDGRRIERARAALAAWRERK